MLANHIKKVKEETEEIDFYDAEEPDAELIYKREESKKGGGPEDNDEFFDSNECDFYNKIWEEMMLLDV